MTQLKEALWGWTALVLIVLCLTGCAQSNASYRLPPIYLLESELSCLSTGTKAQILTHNCTVDYDPKFCPPDKKPNKGN